MKIDGEGFSAYMDPKGNIQKIVFEGKIFEPSMEYSFYEINGETADVSGTPSEKELSLKLTTKKASGTLTVSPGKEIRIHLDPDQENAAENVSLVLSFPLETAFHIPEIYNLGRKIDSEMPVLKWHSTKLGYNFFLANLKGMWIRFMTRQTGQRNPSVYISRHPKMFIVTFTWNLADDALMAVFSSMDEAIKDYETWLEKDLGFRKLRDDPNVPEWVHNVKLILFVDMMRSYGEIVHDYDDVIHLAEDLKRIGCPKDTLLYIPGWNGAYDSAYPTYQPHPELGGEQKFREMMETLHQNGLRVMIHTNAWGLDPCHPNIDEYLKYVLKDEDGNYEGWQTGGKIWGKSLPWNRPLKFRSEKVPFHCPKGDKCFSFETIHVPDKCEALITVGNLKIGEARVKFTIGRRSMLTPQGWFKDHEEYAFPFPLLLQRGRNKVKVEIIGEEEPDWRESWYKIRYSFIPIGGHTYPILRADTKDPGWIKIFVDEVASAIRKYNIDSIHADATHYERDKEILDALKERLPDIPMGGEELGTLGDLGYCTFCQNARHGLLSRLDATRLMGWKGYLPDRSEIEETYSWLTKPSPVGNFVKDYVKIYPHLCFPDAFVPVISVCEFSPPCLSPRKKEEIRKTLRDASKLNYIPGLRLNYREYGLDEETKKAIQEIASTAKCV